MKRLMIAALILAATAVAQTIPESLKLHLSTPASVSDAVLQPGDYTIRTSETSGNVVLSIESDRGRAHVLAIASRLGSNPTEFNQVVLVRDGDAYRLDKVWIGNDGYEILHTAR
jgi:hypothetical protein